MYSLESYEESFLEAKTEYLQIAEMKNEASALMKWMMDNDIIPTFIIPRQWQEKTFTLEGFIELYKYLHWCLTDDGRVMFLHTSDGPILYFDEAIEYFDTLPDKLPPSFGSPDWIAVEEEFVGDIFDFMEQWEKRNEQLINYRLQKFGIEWISWDSYKQQYYEKKQ